MLKKQVKEKIVDFIKRDFFWSGAIFDSDVLSDLGLDYLDMLELTLILEDEFKIELEPGLEHDGYTISEIIETVVKLVESKERPESESSDANI